MCLPHPEIFAALEPGASLLVNDGKIRLKVDACGPDFADCTVVIGGVISNRKGVNVPDVELPLAALSAKDKADLEFACGLGVDWLALSFVQRVADVEEARVLVKGRAAILSKIEKPNAVDRFDEILAVSDGIMVARGDLGVELPVQNVPPIQKRLVRKCRAAAKPVIVATQMLESMIESPMPTRAEVSDVATAIYEGADAVMLSAESAAGDFPIEAVTTMDNVAREVEVDPTYTQIIEASRTASRGLCGGRDRGGGTGNRGNHRHQSDLLFHPKRDNRAVDGPGTTAGADHRNDASGEYGASPCAQLGHQLCDHRRDEPFQKRGRQRGQSGNGSGIRQYCGSDRCNSRCALQCAGDHQYLACGPMRRTFDFRIRSRVACPTGRVW